MATAVETQIWAYGSTIARSWQAASSGVVKWSMWWTVRMQRPTALALMQSWAWLAGQRGEPADLGTVDGEGGRPLVEFGVVVETQQVAAEAGLGQGEQPYAGGAGLLDEAFGDGEVLLEVATELGGDGRHAQGGHDAAPIPVTVSATASVISPSGQRSPTPRPSVSCPHTAPTAGPAGGGVSASSAVSMA